MDNGLLRKLNVLLMFKPLALPARRLLDAKYDVVGFDIDPARAARFASLGGRPVGAFMGEAPWSVNQRKAAKTVAKEAKLPLFGTHDTSLP